MTKDEMIDAAVESMFDVPTTTKVRCWGFKFDEKFYQVINFWLPPIGEHVAVFNSNKKGKRVGEKAIVEISACKDPVKGIEKLADFLMPETSEDS